MNDVAQAFQGYLLTQKRVARNTLMAYQQDIAQFFAFLEQEGYSHHQITADILRMFVVSFKQESDVKARTLARKISTLKTLLLFLHERYGLPDLRASLVFPKLERSLPQFLTEQETEKLLSTALEDTTVLGKRNYIVTLLLYATGMRISELINLPLSALHFDTGFLTVLGKGSKERLIPLGEQLLPLLRHYIQEVHPLLSVIDGKKTATPLLFPVSYRKSLKPLTRQAAWAIIKDLAKKSGIEREFSPHTLRHTLATHLLEKGANLRLLQVWLGHENVSTVEIYTHVNTTHLRKIYDKKHPRAQ